MDITDRQKKLLLTIIQEFIDTAEAVGSISLQNKYNFKVSPATIRNEMAELVAHGFLYQKNSSGGRIPTTKGWRYFIEALEKAALWDELDILAKEEIRTRLNKVKFDQSELIREAISQLSKLSNNAAFALVDGEVYYAGLSQMVNIPEFRETAKLQKALALLEDYYTLSEVVNGKNGDDDVKILIGEETKQSEFEDYAVVFSEIRTHDNKDGYIAVLGPNRMAYNQIIPVIKYLTNTLKRLVSNW